MIFRHHARRNTVKLVGERSSILDLARGRIVLVSAFFALAFIMVAARAFDLGFIQASARGGSQTADSGGGSAAGTLRADIRDRNGVLLATTLRTASLYADPRLISDPRKTATALADIFPDLVYGDTLQKLQSAKRFVWLRRTLTPEEQYAVLELGEPGLGFQHGMRRVYPQGHLAAHLVGYADIDNEGLAGVERSFNKILDEGHDLDLTLDIRLQHALRREVVRAMKDFRAVGAVGAIMDVTTGEILAGVSVPDFDPHTPGSAREEAMFNRLTLGAYELGSVFKIFSTAAFLETHDVPLSTTFDASEPIKQGRFEINDYHAQDRILTIPEIFMYSSNIGSALMGQAVGTKGLRDFYNDIGLLTPLEFEIREVARPIVPDPWRDINTLTAAYGHGIATTPLQLVAAVSSILNGGYLVHPTLVMPEADRSRESIRVVSPQTAHRLRQLMRLVVTDGTGSKAEVPGLRVGGKTGTAEKIGGKGYDRQRLISSFIGVFPIEEPHYAVFIAVDEPKPGPASAGYATGGWVAAPAVARVIVSMASILGISPKPLPQKEELGESLKQYVSHVGHE